MKKVYLLLLFVFGFSAFAQQKGISYQAVIINPNAVAAPGYNGTSIPLANKAICLSFKIVNSANQVEYQESQSITTDGYGMVNVIIGTGTSVAGLVSTLEAVAWNQGNKKLVVGVNTDGVCSNYSEISNQVLNYTPYSFYAQNADLKDGYVTTAKLADGAVTDPKIAMGINPAKVGLGNVNNTSDANKPVSTATQNALNLKANATDVTTSLALKEDISNKSNASLGTSTTLYPTQNAVKTYVDSQISSATIVDADATTKGKIKLAGDLAGTADVPTVPGLALKAPLVSPSFTGTVTAPTYASTPISLTYSGSTIDWNPVQGLNAAITLTQNSALSFTANPPVGSYGTIVLTQDGTGNRTITLPSIAGVTNQILGSTSTTSVTLSTAANAKDILNFYYDGTNCYWNIGQGYGTAAATTSSTANLATGVTGTLAVANGGTGTTSLTGLVKGNGTTALTAAVAGTDYQAPITLTTTGSGAASLTGTTLNIPSTTNYTLPTSSASVIGGVKVGTNLSIDGSGVLSTATSPAFTGAITAPIYASTPQTLTDATTIAWDPANGLNANVTLGGNRTLSFTTTPTAGSYGTLVVTQDATGGRTITLPSTANKVLGSTSTTTIALSSAANAKDILNFYYDGTNCYWNVGQGYGSASTFTATNIAGGASGSIPYQTGSGATSLLAKGTDGQILTLASGIPSWAAAPVTGVTSASSPLSISSNALSLGTVPVANGGTGLSTTPSNGQIDIGNGTGFSRTTLTAGTGISITNGSGAITIASSGTAGVPYSGANQAVDLGAYDLTVNGLTVGKGKKDAGTAFQYNSAFGVSALGSFSGGTKNTALGYNALSSVTSTDQNIAIGAYAMGSTTDYFQQSVAVGNQSLQYNKGSFNTALGSGALSGTSLTSAATYLVGVGALALMNNTSGQNNTAVGSYALSTNTTGNNNTALGQGADVLSAALDNATAIGYNAKVSSSNSVQLGNTSVTNVKTSGTITAGDITYPKTHGTANQVLTTTGSGTLSWTTPASSGGTHAIGESYGGGIVFYTWDNGAHGLIGANTELNNGQAMTWGGGSNSYVGTTSSSGVLGGKMNTQRILNVIPVPTYGNGDPQTGQRSAAFYAATYLNSPVVVNGVTTTPQFSDWYLPNSYELTLFATQSAYFPNCNFATHDHWTSSERSDYAYLAYALAANSNTNIYQTNKSSTNYVVAIRSF